MNLVWRLLIAFLAVTGAVAIATSFMGVEFSHSNFWEHHGVFFLIMITFFPRLTLLFSSVQTGGIIWWLSWIFAPRVLVAVLATLAYWYQNPLLVLISWLVAFGGESSEKYMVVRHSRGYREGFRGYESAKWVDAETNDKNL